MLVREQHRRLSIGSLIARLLHDGIDAHAIGDPMKYLCMVYRDEARIGALAGEDCDVLMDAVLDYREELRQSGHYITSLSLHPTETAVVVRVRAGNLTVRDVPCAGSQEQLGGLYLIEARDLNEAIRLTAKMPHAWLGSVEVRTLDEADRV